MPPEMKTPVRKRSNWPMILIIVVIAVLTIGTILVVRSCEDQAKLAPNSPNKTAAMLKAAIEQGDYTAFQALFAPASASRISRETFSNLKDSVTESAIYANYTLVRLENGRLLLVYLTTPDSKGNYQVLDVKLVPENMQSLFNH
jgi:hypothetical protein